MKGLNEERRGEGGGVVQVYGGTAKKKKGGKSRKGSTGVHDAGSVKRMKGRGNLS